MDIKKIELLENPINIKATYDKKDKRTIITYDSSQTKHDGCLYSVMGKWEVKQLNGNTLTLR